MIWDNLISGISARYLGLLGASAICASLRKLQSYLQAGQMPQSLLVGGITVALLLGCLILLLPEGRRWLRTSSKVHLHRKAFMVVGSMWFCLVFFALLSVPYVEISGFNLGWWPHRFAVLGLIVFCLTYLYPGYGYDKVSATCNEGGRTLVAKGKGRKVWSYVGQTPRDSAWIKGVAQAVTLFVVLGLGAAVYAMLFLRGIPSGKGLEVAQAIIPWFWVAAAAFGYLISHVLRKARDQDGNPMSVQRLFVSSLIFPCATALCLTSAAPRIVTVAGAMFLPNVEKEAVYFIADKGNSNGCMRNLVVVAMPPNESRGVICSLDTQHWSTLEAGQKIAVLGHTSRFGQLVDSYKLIK